MKRPGQPPLTHMDGLPNRDDAELAGLMEAVGRLPRPAVEAVVRKLYRAALAYERTDNVDYLSCLADDALVTMRLRDDPEYEKALTDAPSAPGGFDDAVDVEGLLARRGL